MDPTGLSTWIELFWPNVGLSKAEVKRLGFGSPILTDARPDDLKVSSGGLLRALAVVEHPLADQLLIDRYRLR